MINKLLMNDISSYLTGYFNLPFSLVIPFHDSKLKRSNYRAIFLISNIEKVLEIHKYNRLYNFLEVNSFIYDLQFGYR